MHIPDTTTLIMRNHIHKLSLVAIAALIAVLSSAAYASAQPDSSAGNHSAVTSSDNVDDSAITAKAKEALTTDKDTSSASSAIHVLASRGVVTLTGDVTSQATAEHAQQVVAQVTGVRDVVNDLKYPHMTDSNPSVVPPANSTEQ